uniref:phenylalanine--tRNA ligase subunit beta n=1 Tax=Vaginimicrobium propionicum TaxID=1871034 RepID=UPI0009707B68|nr:phenylalanine--tRNA ligase subunit beta [Vaginimicrobium propionicum]
MRVSINWLRSLVDVGADVTTVEIAQALTRMGLQVERIETFGEVSGPIVVGRVLEFEENEQKNGKLIRWCQVDVGEEKPRGIICGAHNFAPGDLVVVALPGAVLPGDFQISARKTYGHISDGMICAADELGIGEDHSGIIVLPADIDAATGDKAMPILGAPDEVLEIDVTPDLGCYALSMRGMAREVAQSFGLNFDDPYATKLPEPCDSGQAVELATKGCTSFVALTVENLNPKAPSPLWMKARLAAAGMRSISLAVDVTNYVMLESGQPLHAYDGDRLSGAITVRQAHQGETLVTLDNVKRELTEEDILITDDSGPIGLAGVMGGLTTEIELGTTNIVLEGAHFDPVLIGRTFRRHKLPSEASTRFARTVDPQLGFAAVLRAGELLAQYGGATITDKLTVVGSAYEMPQQTMSAELPAKILGTPVEADEVVQILRTAGVHVEGHDELTLTPPSWRADLVDRYDYVEEVGRKVGIDDLVARVPRASAGRGLSKSQKAKRAIVSASAAAGFVEVLTLPFVGYDELDKLGLDASDPRRASVRLANPLSDTQPYLRTTLLPGLFAAAARNVSRSQSDLSLFEVGSVFPGGNTAPAPMLPVRQRPSAQQIRELFDSVPRQPRHLGAVLTGNWLPAAWDHPAVAADWRHALALAETIVATVGLKLTRKAGKQAPWHPGRCAQLNVGETVIGYAGELHPNVCQAFELPARSCALEIDLDELIALAPDGGEVQALSPFPLTKEDVALIVDESVPVDTVQQALIDGGGQWLETIRLFDIYRGDQIGVGKKSLAFALGFRHPQRTLKESEAVAALADAVELASQRCGAVQRGVD